MYGMNARYSGNRKMKFYIGTSGFQYAHWNNGVFYPRGTKDRLGYIFSMLNAVEINSSFYSIPKPETVASWTEKIPDGAKMILKVPQSVSHRRRLKLHSDPRVKQGIDLLRYFIEGCLRIPAKKRGPALLQLPHRMEVDLARLEAVLRVFAEREVRVALEIRHESWFASDTFDLLARYNAAFVSSDWIEFKTPLIHTADFCYVRRHGPTGCYNSLYDAGAIEEDVSLLLEQPVRETYVLFNNDIHGYAPANAMEMRAVLARRLEQTNE
jgi:uncharacterized protein YecE (DUF72 family)